MPYKILGIAPYEALKTAIEEVGKGFPELELHVYVGDLEEGAEIVREKEKEGYDLLLSRGGTTKKLKGISALPVVDIPLSVYDILRTIRLAEQYEDRYAIVGFPNITGSAHILCDLLKSPTEIITLEKKEDLALCIEELRKKEIRIVIGDMVTYDYARRNGMNALLITSGVESIYSALTEALETCKNYASLQEEKRFLYSIVEGGEGITIVLSAAGEVYLSTLKKNSPEEKTMLHVLQKEVKHILQEGEKKFFRTIDKQLFSVSAKLRKLRGEDYILFNLQATKIPLSNGRYGIRFSNKEEVEEEFYNSIYSITAAMGILGAEIEEIAKSKSPIMISQEEGMGREILAGYLYLKGNYSSHPFMTVNCSIMDHRGWEYLLHHYNSPINDNENTIFFENIHQIPEDKYKKLISSILDSGLSHRNKLIFSGDICLNEEEKRRDKELLQKLFCVPITMPPLRERVQEIPLLANLYLNKLNKELGKQIMGLEPAAMELLEGFSWPQNYKQFRRVLMEAASGTKSSYINKDSVATILQKEQKKNLSPALLNGRGELPKISLEEMNRQIIKRVLEENEGNQSKTAKQLGISRTTLWRILGAEKK